MSNEKKKHKGSASKPDDIPLGAERNVGEYKEKTNHKY